MQNIKSLKPLITRADIEARIQQLGAQITNDYQGKDLLCVGILKGAVPFFTALIQAIDLPLHTDFICVSSYHGNTQSSGKVNMVMDLLAPVAGRHLLLMEDVVDSGTTMQMLLELLRKRQPASIKVAALLQKPAMLKANVVVDYGGFEIGNEFVIGYGLDYQERYRNLPYITTLPVEWQ